MTKLENMNVLSLLVDHNKKNNDCIGAEDICGLMMVFLGAGMDTSLQTTSSSIVSMAYNAPAWFDKL